MHTSIGLRSAPTMRRILATALASGVAVLVAACGSSSPSGGTPAQGGSGGQSSPGNTHLSTVTLRTNLTPNGKDAIHYYAKQLGYYRKAGLNVDISPSPDGSTAALNAVATGQVDFAYVSGAVALQGVAEGKPVVVVGAVLGKALDGFFVSKNSPIHAIKQMSGHSVVVTPAILGPMKADLKYLGVDPSTLHIVTVNTSAIVPVYESGKEDAVWTTASLAAQAEKQRPSRGLLIANAGLNIPGYVLATNKTFLANYPQIVRRFVGADLKGAWAAKQNPTAAIAALLQAYPQLEQSAALTTLEVTLPFYCSSSQKGKPYGSLVASDFARTANAYNVAGSHEASTFETNRFFTGPGAIKVGDC